MFQIQYVRPEIHFMNNIVRYHLYRTQRFCNYYCYL